MTNWKTLLMAATAVFALVGCGNSTPEPTTPMTTPSSTATGSTPAKKDIRIAMIAKSSTNPVFQSAKTGAEAAAKELGPKLGVNVKIEWLTPPQEDGQVQAQRIQQAVNDGVDAVLISCSDASKVNGAIADAVAKNVSVMTFDSDAPDSKRFSFYGADDVECGAQVIQELAKVMHEKGNVAILAGSINAPNLQKRVQGAKEELKKHPGMKLVDVFYHPETPQDASAAVVQAMNANPQIDSWAMIGGWPLFAPSLLKLDPAKVKIVAVDALAQELPYVDRGIAPVLLAQPVFEWGHKSVEIILDKIVSHKDVPAINKMALVRVTKENLGDWAKQLKDWGFADVDQKYLDMAKK